MKKPRIFRKGEYWFCDFYSPTMVRGWGATPQGAYADADTKMFLRLVSRMVGK